MNQKWIGLVLISVCTSTSWARTNSFSEMHEALEDTNVENRRIAAQSLVEYTGPRADTLILQALNDSDSEVIDHAILAYRGYQGPDRPSLEIEAFQNPNPIVQVRLFGAQVGGAPRTPRARFTGPPLRTDLRYFGRLHLPTSALFQPRVNDQNDTIPQGIFFPNDTLGSSPTTLEPPDSIEASASETNEQGSRGFFQSPPASFLARIRRIGRSFNLSNLAELDGNPNNLLNIGVYTARQHANPHPIPAPPIDPIIPIIPPSTYQIIPQNVLPYEGLEERVNAAISRLENRISKKYRSSNLFDLVKDYETAQVVINKAEDQNRERKEQYKINYHSIAFDPFSTSSDSNIDQAYPEAIPDETWREMQISLLQAPGVNKLIQNLDRIFSITNYEQFDSVNLRKTKVTQRKRIKRIFDEVQNRTSRAEKGQVMETPLGDLALHLHVNEERCIDGLGDGITELEQRYLKSGNLKNAGEFISHIFLEYRMSFINRHADLNPNSSEFQTTIKQILRQRMLYSLNLKEEEGEIAYPSLGNPSEKGLQPTAVMIRFIAGEDAKLDLLGAQAPTVKFQPFNIEKMVELLQNSRERGLLNLKGLKPLHINQEGIKLTNSLIQKFSATDEVLLEAYHHLFSEGGRTNAFFTLAPLDETPGNIRLKDAFWLYLLEKFNYITRN